MYNNKGYSMVDMVLALTMVLILSSIAYPHVAGFLNVQRDKEERAVQVKIIDALSGMAEAEGQLPMDDPLNPPAAPALMQGNIDAIANDLTRYTNLSVNEIQNDAWDNTRFYMHIQENLAYREVTIPINYVYVMSLGDGACLGTGASAQCNNVAIAASITAMLTDADDFQDLEAYDGDVLTKYTDLSLRTAQYEVTRERLEAITDALTEYETIRRYEGVVEGEDQRTIYYPPDSLNAGNMALYSTAPNYQASFNDDEGLAGNPVNVGGGNAQRRTSMQALMRTIGLPEEYCCTPLFMFDDGGERVETPFYYYSNARSRRANGTCTARAGVNDRKLPAKVTVRPDNCG